MERRLISLREASQYSGIDQNYLRVLINRNILRGAKDRGDWFITETDLDDYLANHSRKKKKITFNKIAADVKPLEISADLQRLGNTRHKTFSPRGVLHSVTKENLVYFLNKEIEETLANQGIKWPETPGDLSIHRYVKLIPKVVVGTVILAGLGSFVLLAGPGDVQNLSRAVRGFPTLIGKYLAAADRNRIGPSAVPEAITDVLQKLDGLSTVILTRLDDDTYHFNRIFGQVFNYLGSGYSSGLVTLLDRYNAQPGANLVSGLFSNLQPLFAKFFIGSGLRETVTPAPGYFEFMAEVDKTRAVGVGETKVVVQSVVTPVRQIVERIETLVPGDVGELRLELTRAIQIEVNKLRAELASLEGSLTTTSRISDSSIRMVTLSQRIDELNAINIDNGATICSVNLSVSRGSVTAPSATFTNLTVGSFSANSTSATSTISTGGFAVGTNQFVVQQSTGNVGIGTTSPSDTLALNGAMYFAYVSVPSVTSNRLYNAGGDLYWAGSVIGGSTTGTWTTDGTNVWRAGGSVGIGTTTPSSILNVYGSTTIQTYIDQADAFKIVNAATSTVFVFDTINIRLGIGTSSPATTTSIAGAAYITGGLGVGRATGTPGVIETTGVINVQGSGTSTFANGINATTGCFAINGACLVSGVSSVSNSDGTLTISPTTGNVVASLNLANANTWTGGQTFNLSTSTSATSTSLFAVNATLSTSTIGYLTVGSVTATSTSASSTLQNFLFTQAQGTGLSLTNLTVSNATTTSLNITSTVTGAGLASCSGALNKLLWSSSTNQFACGSESGAGASNWIFSGVDAITPTSTTVGIIVNASSSIANLSMMNSTTTNATTTYLNVSTLASTSQLTINGGLVTYGRASTSTIPASRNAFVIATSSNIGNPPILSIDASANNFWVGIGTGTPSFSGISGLEVAPSLPNYYARPVISLTGLVPPFTSEPECCAVGDFRIARRGAPSSAISQWSMSFRVDTFSGAAESLGFYFDRNGDSFPVIGLQPDQSVYINKNLGVGTSSPWALLSVNPNNIGSGPSFVVGSSTQTNFIITNTGVVGISTSTPTPLVGFAVGTSTYIVGGLGVGVATTSAGVIETTGVINVQGAGTSSFSNGLNLADGCFSTRGACAALGGTTINSGTANRLAYYSGIGTIDSANYLTTDITNSRLGIGITTPTEKLDVAGNINLDQ